MEWHAACVKHMFLTQSARHSRQKVTANHTKGQAVIVAENEIVEADIAKALEPTGYRMVSYSCAPYQKKKLFGIFG